jgi:glycosyltransferase involved in cell wall biosynthesis
MPTIHKGIIRFAAQKRSRLRLLAGAVYDIGVFPSCSDEGFSMSIVEAMSRGKPVIATHLGGIPEGVGNEGLCGWLCANSAAEGFARAITLTRAADLEKMGQNSRRRAAGFRWSVEAARFLEFIEGPGNRILGDI